MKNRTVSIGIIGVLLVIFVLLCGFKNEAKDDPVLDTEKRIIYSNCEISKLVNDAKLEKNRNLVGEKVVFIGVVREIDGKEIHISKSSSDKEYVKVKLSNQVNIKLNSVVIVFGEVKEPKNKIATVEAEEIATTNDSALQAKCYMYEVDGQQLLRYPYNDGEIRKLNGGEIQFEIPENWIDLGSEEYFSKKLNEKDNACCYQIGAGECVGIFYFDFETYLGDNEKNDVKLIEKTIIHNICSGHKVRKVPQKVFRPIYDDVVQHAYVVSKNEKKDIKSDTEFQFREVNGGLLVVVYIYDENRQHTNDVVYMLSTVQSK